MDDKTNIGTLKYMDDESDDIFSDSDSNSNSRDEPFINANNISMMEEIDEEARTIITKRVKDREIQFNSLSLGDDFVETFWEQLK